MYNRDRLLPVLRATLPPDYLKTTLYGVEISVMTPEELQAALAWALQRNHELLMGPIPCLRG